MLFSFGKIAVKHEDALAITIYSRILAFSVSNTDGWFTKAISNSFLSPLRLQILLYLG